ncbi:hypothetical protein [Pseudooceanicola spongiae]|uniref:hypothetical protein n=1 Tax=Pseudooceanicola spongiae TaxID=2613965 RepID=UPI0018676D15|nr:hypothetical protein [Pseudooceanicola spongiae]
MVVKVVILFLVGMGVMAMFGKLTLPGQKKPGAKKPGQLGGKKCSACGRYMIGKGPCACRSKKG